MVLQDEDVNTRLDENIGREYQDYFSFLSVACDISMRDTELSVKLARV